MKTANPPSPGPDGSDWHLVAEGFRRHDPRKKKLAKFLVRRCQWMVENRNWADCGKPATLMHRPSASYYCQDHGDAMSCMVGEMVGLPPNDRGQARRDNQ